MKRQLAVVLVAAAALTACSRDEDGGARSPSDDAESSASQTPSGSASASGSAGGASTPSPSAETRPGKPEVVATGLRAPWSIAFHKGARLISERDDERIVEVDGSGATREVGSVPGVVPNGEGGLLGIAVHEGWLYAYSTGESENRIHRFRLQGKPGALSLGEPELILDGIPAASFHNGGRIAFGPDGMLYATVGDAGQDANAQDRGSLSGKILRMTPTGEAPQDNPFEGSLIYSLGHRNSQGLAWATDGTMYAAEFGQDTWDELNRIEPGKNYGWPEVEGIAGDQAKQQGFVDPIQQWSPAEASPSGLAIAAGTAYLVGLRGERLFEIPLAKPGATREHLVEEFGRLRDVVLAPDGSLLVLTNNTDGRGDPGPDDDRLLRLPLR